MSRIRSVRESAIARPEATSGRFFPWLCELADRLPRKGLAAALQNGVLSTHVLRRQGRRTIEALVDAGLDVTRGRPLDGDGVLLRCLPWLTAGPLPCAFLPLPPHRPSH